MGARWSTIAGERPTWDDWEGSTWDEVEATPHPTSASANGRSLYALNRAPRFGYWTLVGGAYWYEEDGEEVLRLVPGSYASFRMRVADSTSVDQQWSLRNEARVVVPGETTPASDPRASIHRGSLYRKDDGSAVTSSLGWTGNGNARPMSNTGAWDLPSGWSLPAGDDDAGERADYVEFRFYATSTHYSPPSGYEIRRVVARNDLNYAYVPPTSQVSTGSIALAFTHSVTTSSVAESSGRARPVFLNMSATARGSGSSGGGMRALGKRSALGAGSAGGDGSLRALAHRAAGASGASTTSGSGRAGRIYRAHLSGRSASLGFTESGLGIIVIRGAADVSSSGTLRATFGVMSARPRTATGGSTGLAAAAQTYVLRGSAQGASGGEFTGTNVRAFHASGAGDTRRAGAYATRLRTVSSAGAGTSGTADAHGYAVRLRAVAGVGAGSVVGRVAGLRELRARARAAGTPVARARAVFRYDVHASGTQTASGTAAGALRYAATASSGLDVETVYSPDAASLVGVAAGAQAVYRVGDAGPWTSLAEGAKVTLSPAAGDIVQSVNIGWMRGGRRHGASVRASRGRRFAFEPTRYAPVTVAVAGTGEATRVRVWTDTPYVAGNLLLDTTIAAYGTTSVEVPINAGAYIESDALTVVEVEGVSGDGLRLWPSTLGALLSRRVSRTVTWPSGERSQTGVADGSGGDAEAAVPAESVGSVYAVPHDVSDYYLKASTRGASVAVERWDGDAWVLEATHTLGTGQAVQVGPANGAGAPMWTGVTRFRAADPFLLVLNDPATNDEWTPSALALSVSIGESVGAARASATYTLVAAGASVAQGAARAVRRMAAIAEGAATGLGSGALFVPLQFTSGRAAGATDGGGRLHMLLPTAAHAARSVAGRVHGRRLMPIRGSGSRVGVGSATSEVILYARAVGARSGSGVLDAMRAKRAYAVGAGAGVGRVYAVRQIDLTLRAGGIVAGTLDTFMLLLMRIPSGVVPSAGRARGYVEWFADAVGDGTGDGSGRFYVGHPVYGRGVAAGLGALAAYVGLPAAGHGSGTSAGRGNAILDTVRALGVFRQTIGAVGSAGEDHLASAASSPLHLPGSHTDGVDLTAAAEAALLVHS